MVGPSVKSDTYNLVTLGQRPFPLPIMRHPHNHILVFHLDLACQLSCLSGKVLLRVKLGLGLG